MDPAKPIRVPEIVTKEIGNESVLYSSKGEAIHVLNATAKMIWELCDGQHTSEDMAQVLTSRFTVGSGFDIMQDVNRTLQVFKSKGLLLL